eukprot:scaffold23076_cov92-Phaeocystis_antarctica.AAC.2
MRFCAPKHERPTTEATHAASSVPEPPPGSSSTWRSSDGRTLQHRSCQMSTGLTAEIWPLLGSKLHMTRVRCCGHSTTPAPGADRGRSPPSPSKMLSHRQLFSETASSRAHAFAFSMSTCTAPKRPERAPGISDVEPLTATGSVDQSASLVLVQRTPPSSPGSSWTLRRCSALLSHRSVVTASNSLRIAPLNGSKPHRHPAHSPPRRSAGRAIVPRCAEAATVSMRPRP